MSVKSFRDLKAWEKAHELVLKIYELTKSFPEDKRFGLISQLRRASSSIPTNIVEGFKRNTTNDFIHFLNIADASLEETKYHILLSKDLNYLTENNYKMLLEKCEEIGKMLSGLQKSLYKKAKSGKNNT